MCRYKEFCLKLTPAKTVVNQHWAVQEKQALITYTLRIDNRCVSGMNELLCWTIKGEQRYSWINTLWHFEGSSSLRGMNLLKMTLLHGYISVAPPDPTKIIVWWRILSMSNFTMNLSPDGVGIHLGKTVVILIYFYWTTDAVLYN